MKKWEIGDQVVAPSDSYFYRELPVGQVVSLKEAINHVTVKFPEDSHTMTYLSQDLYDPVEWKLLKAISEV